MLLDEIRDRIRDRGPMTFAEFMHLALYHPRLGFYASADRGPGHDYQTSPTLTPLFGKLLARGITELWRGQGEPSEFTVIEVGGGDGKLAAQVLEGTNFAVRWEFVERSVALQRVQTQAVHQAEWRDSLASGEAVTGLLLAHEVFDNFPVHLLEVAEGEAKEIYVGIEGNELVELSGPVSSKGLAAHSARAVKHLNDGDRFEVCTGLAGWWREAGQTLVRGHVMVIDYGDTEPDIWTRRPSGTLVTYSNDSLNLSLLDSPGQRDITAHVNFTALARAAEAAGFSRGKLETQRNYLLGLGVADLAADLKKQQAVASSAGRHGDEVALLAQRSKLTALSARGGLGDLLVFTASKDL